MPMRPATHQPHFAKTPEQRERTERERQRRKDAERPSASERGYDAEWRALRASFLADNPTCAAPGCGQPAVDVDHVEDVRAHPERRLDRSNLRAFCHRHHSQRTARDQGFARGSDGAARVSTRAALHPDWLRPSRVPLYLVCGPPASGKSTYVAEQAALAEVVIDYNEIRANLSGLPYHPGKAWRDEAIRHRNSQLGKLSAPNTKIGGAWLSLGEPKAERRLWWRIKLRPLSIIVMATPADVCHARIDADARRDLIRDQQHAAVDAWWRDYEPMPGERTLRSGGEGR